MMKHYAPSEPKAPVQLPHESILLEDWPQYNSSKDQEADSDPQPAGTPQVSFSDTSTLFVYNDVDYLHQEKKSYSKKELDTYRVKAMIDVHRIKHLIVGCQQSSVVESIMYLVENDIIARDELVGLDHLILGTPSSVTQVRHNHMSAVLWKQHEQQHLVLHSELDDDEEEADSVMELGKCAQRSSLHSTHQGIARAKLSYSA